MTNVIDSMPTGFQAMSGLPTETKSDETKTAAKKDTSLLDENGFLKLFLQSMQNQDPMEPMNNGEMMQQLNQLTMIQNTMNMKKAVEELVQKEAGINPISKYLDLIGKQVKVKTDKGDVEGQVLSVGSTKDGVFFEFMNGQSFNVNQITGASQY
ncbi:flagellar hook assembly protein FlgD [Bacillus toyonensis]|uniref:flagellar hook assembly protein FlgD n=1 Tax=Bacillus toyonensis TaxID=155322 RepID=UPI002E21D569|nr:flagellar hook capping FlgD N-terminal domain-containing protein [Bacillus toyonensis]